MIKRVVIAGCRDYNNYVEAETYIDFCLSDIRRENNIIIVSGCASGADAIGERYAEENGLKVLAKLPINPEFANRIDNGDVESIDGEFMSGAIEAVENA